MKYLHYIANNHELLVASTTTIVTCIIGLFTAFITNKISINKMQRELFKEILAAFDRFNKDAKEYQNEFKNFLVSLEANNGEVTEEVYDEFIDLIISYSNHLDEYLVFTSLLYKKNPLLKARQLECWDVLNLFPCITKSLVEKEEGNFYNIQYIQIISLITLIKKKSSLFQRIKLYKFLCKYTADKKITSFYRAFFN